MEEKDLLFVGVDVACAKEKRIPTAILRRTSAGWSLLPLKVIGPNAPRCTGNGAIALNRYEAARIAAEYVDWLEALQTHLQSSIHKIIIDSPSQPCPEEMEARDCERCLRRAGISFFRTPSLSRFEALRTKAKAHLKAKNSVASVPGANLWWMLVGFELFRALRARGFVCVESYPQAILKTLGYEGAHKSSAVWSQFNAFKSLSHLDNLDDASVRVSCHGSLHDKVDALMCAWLATLSEDEVQYFGNCADDQICVPKFRHP